MPHRRSVFPAVNPALLGLAAALFSPVAQAAPVGLETGLTALAAQAKGQVGIAVTHIETGQTTTVAGDKPLPTFSVMKLPVAIAILAEVEAGRLSLARTVHVSPADLVPGGPGNTERWADTPKDLTVQQLLDLSLVYSDNTSSEKLLALLGGPAGVTRKLATLHQSQGLDVRGSFHNTDPRKFNRATPAALVRLLASLWKGELVARPQLDLLLDCMTRSPNGVRRLRGRLPPGTPVADKTGTGGDGAGTNDVGFITLPPGKGHLAVAVLIADSKLPPQQQEELIAAIARAAYDAHLAPSGDQRTTD